jgi:hypothetical protein
MKMTYSTLVLFVLALLVSSVVSARDGLPCSSQSTNSYVMDAYVFCWYNTTSTVSMDLYVGSTLTTVCYLTVTVPTCVLNNTIGNYAMNGTITYSPSSPGVQGNTPLLLNVIFNTPQSSKNVFIGGISFTGPTYSPNLPNVMLSSTSQIAWLVNSNTSVTLFFVQGPTVMLEQNLLSSFASSYQFQYAIGNVAITGWATLIPSPSSYSSCGNQVTSPLKVYLLLSTNICDAQHTSCSSETCYAALSAN